ncbi:MAG: hypothetical protein Q8L93_05440 [Rhodocyclaceae bacterium]|nr:hypothetical protein [Rhodocyclaceae bacterium]
MRNIVLNNLPGRYTTLLIDGIPIFSSVSTAYGLDSVSLGGLGFFADDLGGFKVKGRLDIVDEKRMGGAMGRNYAIVSDEIKEGCAKSNFNTPKSMANAVVSAVPDPMTNNYRYKLGRGTLTKVGESEYKTDLTRMSLKPRPIV